MYTCEVSYQGIWAPVMEWRNNGGVLQATNETTPTTAKYTYTPTLTLADDGEVVTCRPYFDQPKAGSVDTECVADNIPSIDSLLTTYTWPKITVHRKYIHCICN